MTVQPNTTDRLVDEALERLARWSEYEGSINDERLVAGELENLRADARVLAEQRDAAVVREELTRKDAEAEQDRLCLERNQQWWSEGQARGELAFVRRQLHDLAAEVAKWPKPPLPVRFVVDLMTTSKGREWWARLEDDGAAVDDHATHYAVVEEAEARVAVHALRPAEEPTDALLSDEAIVAWARAEVECRARVFLAKHGWREEFGAEVGRLLVLQYERGREDEVGLGDGGRHRRSRNSLLDTASSSG